MKKPLLALALLLSSISAQAADGKFVDVYESASVEQSDRFRHVKKALRKSFDQICGDTFCEGDFQNMSALDFACSMNTEDTVLKQCLWTFAGSYTEVNAKTGRVKIGAKMLKGCRIDVDGLTLASFMDQVLKTAKADRGGAIETVLEGREASIYDQINECLAPRRRR